MYAYSLDKQRLGRLGVQLSGAFSANLIDNTRVLYYVYPAAAGVPQM